MEKLVIAESLINKYFNDEATESALTTIVNQLQTQSAFNRMFTSELFKEFVLNILRSYARSEMAAKILFVKQLFGITTPVTRRYEWTVEHDLGDALIRLSDLCKDQPQYNDILETDMVSDKLNTFDRPYPLTQQEFIDFMQARDDRPLPQKIRLVISWLRCVPFKVDQSFVDTTTAYFGGSTPVTKPHIDCVKCLIALNMYLNGTFDVNNTLVKTLFVEHLTTNPLMLIERVLMYVLQYGVYRSRLIRFPARFANIIMTCESVNRDGLYGVIKTVYDPVMMSAILTEHFKAYVFKYSTSDGPRITLASSELEMTEDFPEEGSPEHVELMKVYHDVHTLMDIVGKGHGIPKGAYPYNGLVRVYLFVLTTIVDKMDKFCEFELISRSERTLDCALDWHASLLMEFGKLNIFGEVTDELFGREHVLFDGCLTEAKPQKDWHKETDPSVIGADVDI